MPHDKGTGKSSSPRVPSGLKVNYSRSLWSLVAVLLLVLAGCATDSDDDQEPEPDSSETEPVPEEDAEEDPDEDSESPDESADDEDATASGSEASGDLSVLVWAPGLSDVWVEQADDFMDQHPDVSVNVQAIGANDWQEFFQTVAVQAAGGQPVDVVRVATEGERLFASRGIAAPLDEFIERDRDELEGFFDAVHPDILQQSQEKSSPDDQTYFIPYAFNTVVMYVNMDLIEQSGAPMPTDDWTWEEFDEIATTVTEELGVHGFDASNTSSIFRSVMPWLLTNDANVLNDDWSRSAINTPEAAEAAEFVRSLIERQVSPLPGGEFDFRTLAAQDRLAMFAGTRGDAHTLEELGATDKFEIFHWPQNTSRGSPVGWGSFAILEASENKDAAWEYYKYYLSEEIQADETRNSGSASVLSSIANGPDLLENSPKGMVKLFDALEYATPVPGPDEGAAVLNAVIDTWSQMLTGNTSPDEGLSDLEERINELLEAD